MDMLINNGKTDLFFPKMLDNEINDGEQDKAPNIKETANNIKKIHYYAEQLLMDWLETPPVERRQLQALNLFADAIQMLNAACINLGVINIADDD